MMAKARSRPLPATHTHRRKGAPLSATNTSPIAAKAQVQMVRLLSDHFDADTGAFVDGWTDEKIATQTGIALKAVVTFREAGFGPLKEPEEITKLAKEIEAFRGMVRDADEMLKLMTGELDTLETKLAEVRKRYS